ncbi:hypothetical protein PoB_005043900 [Plakobranchus ocellatus]|uniref:Secreted protein n=1 Tax=Plakobranchus ocellatus TaxID=259542 RepID=A0AAV4BYN0_9GAST|nr:hypothetical protein PoB_005043900 [Plakobranchus ocellatus]
MNFRWKIILYIHIRAIGVVLDDMFNVLSIDVHGYREYVHPCDLLAATSCSVQYEWTLCRHHYGCYSRPGVCTTKFKMVLKFYKKVKNIVHNLCVMDVQAHRSFAESSGTRC